MSQPSPQSGSTETSVRQLIANGKTKTAVETAKDFHKSHPSAASEALLIDAYTARIQALNDQNLKLEAKSLSDLVGARFPHARARIETLSNPRSALSELVAPLADPNLAPESRSAIEQRLQENLHNPQDLAGCDGLPADHPLRESAASLSKAFVAATSGPASEEELSLPEISRRSPLAPWKLLVRAIGHFYRGQDTEVRDCLAAIPSSAAPARLVPALRAMLGDAPAAALPPAVTRLVSLTTQDSSALRNALERLDRLFESDSEDKEVIQAAKSALQECGLHAPTRVEVLKQHLIVRCEMANVATKWANTLGDHLQDPNFLRLFARGMELTHDPQHLVLAAGLWEDFRQKASRKGWFSANGPEAATLYLHIASVLRRMPGDMLEEFQGTLRKKGDHESPFYLFPRILYERACTFDCHSDSFSQWLDWEGTQKDGEALHVADTWHSLLPEDIEPILFLMHDAAERNLFPTALKYLGRAEQLDGVHPAVRRARLQLLAGGVLKYIQQKKPNKAEERIAELAALPQSQQGDRPAFLAALRYLTARERNDLPTAALHRAEVERLLESKVAASLLIFGLATAAKRAGFEMAERAYNLDKAARPGIPAAMARAVALAADMNATKFRTPWSYITEAAKQLPRVAKFLDLQQLRTLAEAGITSGEQSLAYAATAAGLERGGPTSAQFLLLRAKLLARGHEDRRAVCATAAAELARQQRDMQVVEEAVEVARRALGSRNLTLDLDQAAEVLAKENAAKRPPKHPGQGPNYRKFLPKNLCPCPACRAQRGEVSFDEPYGEFDDDFEDEALTEEEFEEIVSSAGLPSGMPPTLARMLLEEMKRAVMRGESPESIQSQLVNAVMGGQKSRKGRRR